MSLSCEEHQQKKNMYTILWTRAMNKEIHTCNFRIIKFLELLLFQTKLFNYLSLYKEERMSVCLFFVDFHAVAPQSTKFDMKVENLSAEISHTSKPHFLFCLGLNIAPKFWNPEKKKQSLLLITRG
jgi:hypothetical protein